MVNKPIGGHPDTLGTKYMGRKEQMKRTRLSVGGALLGLLAVAITGCHDESGPPITPTHPVPLPPPASFTSPPGKGATVGGLPNGATVAPGSLSQDAKTGGLGSKAH